ncbi:MAG: ABC transporter ATP-binding protein/permease [Bdellovibrionaceae bacterium]|jgi:ATP-binding cassette subfamily B multidrug efflux pump|nr:ABC transporter ATP-binding protein/permease [Pseudobdellovibrionaceae bacterium]
MLPWQSAHQLLWWMLLYRPLYKIGVVALALVVSTLGIATPLLQKAFFDSLSTQVQWTWLIAAAGSLLSYFFLYQGLNLSCQKIANETQALLSKQLYLHLLNLRSIDRKGKSIGELIAIYATDIPSSTILLEQSLPQGLNILFPLILAPLALHKIFHVPAVDLLLSLTIFTLLNLLLAFRQSLFFKRFKELAAKRVGLINEWIQNIRWIRLLNLSSRFEQNIRKAREIETENRLGMLTNGQTMNTLASTMTFIFTAFFLWRSSSMSPGNILGIYWIVSVFLTRSFRQLPWFFTFVFDAWTSIQRIYNTFHQLNSPPDFNRELDQGTISNIYTYVHRSLKLDPQDSKSPQTEVELIDWLNSIILKKGSHLGSLKVQGLTLELANKKILEGISFEVKSGEWIAITGAVGAGKSLLLNSLMGETDAHFEIYQIGPLSLLNFPRKLWKLFFTYSPQESFLISSSMRDNLHLEYDAEKTDDHLLYERLLCAQFDPVAERLDAGLDTLIGERGVNLSGGQKQRLNLARLLDKQTPIFLFDDSFSALDILTEKNILEQIKSSPHKATRIMVCHRRETMTYADRVFRIENGKLIEMIPQWSTQSYQSNFDLENENEIKH